MDTKYPELALYPRYDMSSPTFKFHYGVAFEERLLSGSIHHEIGDDFITFDLTYFPDGAISGQYSIPIQLENLLMHLYGIEKVENIKPKYDGHWDDAGSSSFSFFTPTGKVKTTIIHCYEQPLSNDDEITLFSADKELNRLTNEIYEKHIQT